MFVSHSIMRREEDGRKKDRNKKYDINIRKKEKLERNRI